MVTPPAFEAPWHAQLFALTLHLHENGLFDWPEWTERFGMVLAQHGVKKDLDGGDDYFAAWLETLEDLLAEKDQAAPDAVTALHAAWKEAFLSTPHGQPVHLGTRTS